MQPEMSSMTSFNIWTSEWFHMLVTGMALERSYKHYSKFDYIYITIKISRRNINNLRYADDTTLMAEGEEELKSLLMKMKK